ncbi:MAG: hypothetical protein AAF063_36450 [Cyanobacteria bacterium J06643_5]
MLRRLVQAAIITLLLNIILGLSSNTNQVISSELKSPMDTYPEPMISLLVRSLK